MNRPEVSKEEVQTGIRILIEALDRRLDEKGYGAFAGKHEILGIITEEYHELVDAAKNDDDELEFSNELIDIAVAALFGHMSLTRHKNDRD